MCTLQNQSLPFHIRLHCGYYGKKEDVKSAVSIPEFSEVGIG